MDIQEAWDLIEKMRIVEQKVWVVIRNEMIAPEYTDVGWRVILHERGKPLIDGAAIYGTALHVELPEAIRLAVEAFRSVYESGSCAHIEETDVS